MKKDVIQLDFPLAGVDRRWSYQRQAPFSTPDCVNVLPFDPEQGRARGGSRPGTRKAYTNSLGGAVRLISELDCIPPAITSNMQWFEENFESDGFGGRWSTAAWLSDPLVIRNGYAAATAGNEEGGVVLSSLNMDTSNAYTVQAYIAPYRHAFHGIYRIFVRLNNSSPSLTTNGVMVELAMIGDSLACRMYDYASSALANSWSTVSAAQGHSDGGWFRVYVTGTTVAAYWRETLLTSQTVSATGGDSNQRVGFGATCLDPTGQCLFDAFRVQYRKTDTLAERRRHIVAIAGGYLWSDFGTSIGNTLAVGLLETLNFSTTRDLTAAQYGQKLYIADRGVLISGTANAVNGTTFDHSGTSDWTALGLDTSHDVVITSVNSGTATTGTYDIATVASGSLTLGSSASTGAASVEYYVRRTPKIYDPYGGTVKVSSWTATKGTTPQGCEIVCRYRERMFLAGGDQGIQWFMSRQGDPLDFNYGKTAGDAGRAIAGTVADAGVPGDIITAAIPSGDDYLAIFCPTSCWRIVGDPADTGYIQNIHRSIGCIGAKALCNGESGEVYFLSRVGLCMMDRGGNVARMSVERIPRELQNIDTALYSVSLAYDPSEMRVHVYVSDSTNNRSTRHWVYDVRTQSYWPTVLPWDMQPTAAHWFNSPLTKDSGLLLGCKDGYIRRYDRFCDTDDANNLTSYVVIGPIALGGPEGDGAVDGMIADVALDSRDVAYEVHVGDNPEIAALDDPVQTGEFSAGSNHRTPVRKRGNAFTIRIGRESTQQGWGLESISLTRTRLGRRRIV